MSDHAGALKALIGGVAPGIQFRANATRAQRFTTRAQFRTESRCGSFCHCAAVVTFGNLCLTMEVASVSGAANAVDPEPGLGRKDVDTDRKSNVIRWSHHTLRLRGIT